MCIRDYSQIARNYVEAVRSGTIPAPRTVIHACERSHADWIREPSEDWPYFYDEAAAADICRFIERLPHVEGQWAARGELVVLQPWQTWIVTSIFGWKHAETGHRRFRIAYTEVPRKNGKSLLGAAIALAMLLEDGEPGAQVYSAATSREQSKIIFDTAIKMLKKSPGMVAAYGLKVLQHSIAVPETHSILRALASEDRGSISLDGLNPHFVAVDELHAHSSSGTWDALESATGARAQSLIFAITTAGNDRTGVCYQVRTYAQKVVSGAVDDSNLFAAIWGLDDDATDDAWQDPKVWAATNPNLGVSVNEDDLRRQCRKAIEEPSFESNFKTKRLCVWVHADRNLFDVKAFIDSADDEMTREEFKGQQCYVGIDLAPLHDFSAVVYLFPLEDDSFYVLADHYLPAEEIEKNPQFVTWEAQGLIKAVPGNRMDYRLIIEDVIAARDEWGVDIQQVAFDPWQANELSTDLDDARFEIVSVPIRVSHLSEHTKKLEALIAQHKLISIAQENATLAWCLSNVVGHYDRKDNTLPVRPDDRRLKIDSAIALILALSRAIVEGKGSGSVYDDPVTAGDIWVNLKGNDDE